MAVIPNSGTYLQEQNQAQLAYDNAVASLKTKRAQQQKTSGLNADWTVNPQAQYGTYQQMLNAQGTDLEAARNAGYDRGIGGRGLGNQAEGTLRYAQAAQNLGFQNQLAGWEQDYSQGLTGAEQARQSAMLAALQRAQQEALSQQQSDAYINYLNQQQTGQQTAPPAPTESPGYAAQGAAALQNLYTVNPEITQASVNPTPQNAPQLSEEERQRAAALLNYMKQGRKLEL